MLHTQLQEILFAVEQERAALMALVTPLDQDAFDRRPSDDAWSVGEVLDHLLRSETGIVRLLRHRLRKAKDVGPPTGERSWVDSLEASGFGDSATRPLPAPEQVVPERGRSREELLAALEQSRADLMTAAAEADTVDLEQLSFPHPLLGELNMYQWVRFIGVHERRHTAQVEKLVGEG